MVHKNRRRRALFTAAAVLAGAATLIPARPAGAVSTATVTSTGAISIPDSGAANPFPSTINVSGLGTNLSGLKVVLRNVNHTCVKDLDVLLVGPTGHKTTLFSDNGYPALYTNCADLTKTSITIDDSCADFGNSMPSGANICVRPSDNDATGHQGDNWPGVGSEFPALNLSSFHGTNPNGAWKLYVYDDAGSDSGTIGSWELQLTTQNTPPTVTPQVINVRKGVTQTFTVLGTDPDGDPLTCQVPATTVSGKGVLTGTGCTRGFRAGTRTSGTDRIAVRMTDSSGAQSGPADIVFNIENRLPEARDLSLVVGRGERLAITLGGTDPDPGEGAALTCTFTTGNTALGRVTGSGCNVTYIAGTTTGSDSFGFTVNDGFGGTDSGLISITVAEPELPGCTPGESANARYVCRVYLDLLGRPAEPGGKAYWVGRLAASGDRQPIIRSYQGTLEYRQSVVDDVYRTFLNRVPDAGGRNYWAEQLRLGANPDRIRSQVIGSAEFWERAGSAPNGFAAALYQMVVRRPATPADTASVTQKLASGSSAQTLAGALLATREGDVVTAAGIYERYLRRTPGAAETTPWVDRLQRNTSELKIIEAIISSPEYFSRA